MFGLSKHLQPPERNFRNTPRSIHISHKSACLRACLSVRPCNVCYKHSIPATTMNPMTSSLAEIFEVLARTMQTGSTFVF